MKSLWIPKKIEELMMYLQKNGTESPSSSDQPLPNIDLNLALSQDFASWEQSQPDAVEQLKNANEELAMNNEEKVKLSSDLLSANKVLADQNDEIQKRAKELIVANQEKEERAEELILANFELAFQGEEKEKRKEELAVANKELAFQKREKKDRASELLMANEELLFQNNEKENRAKELAIANKELLFQNKEKEKRAGELSLANIELAYQNVEKENRAKELIVANAELAYQNTEKENRAKELAIANKELMFQNKEKEKRAGELTLANIELAYQNIEKENRAAELVVANAELAYQNSEKEHRAIELATANEELHFQYLEKEKRSKELAVANRELLFQNKEKEKRAAELLLANIELAYENLEKENRAKELDIANKELAFQNTEKEKRAAELLVAIQELAFQNTEKEKRAAELLVANQELADQIAEKERRVTESIYLSNHDHLTGLNNRRSYEEELVKVDKEENLPITIIMGDINGLKMINDSFGHAAGDVLLKVIAEILKKVCRPGDLVARIGGDEFVMVIPKSDGSVADQIIAQIKKALISDPSNQLQISASFGHETKTLAAEDIQELFQSAENQMYRHKLSETGSMRSQTIDLIMHTLFAKNPREAKHSERVGFICEKIASFLNLDQSSIYDMRIAGMMHDIGKIGIGESILNKSGKLTEEEWAQIKKHPEIGYRILSTTQEFSMIADCILQHHERWNGCGYPKGLKAEDILRQARIIAIADSFDAMTSERTYRDELTDEQALEEISKCSGTLYDPEIVKVFVARYSELCA